MIRFEVGGAFLCHAPLSRPAAQRPARRPRPGGGWWYRRVGAEADLASTVWYRATSHRSPVLAAEVAPLLPRWAGRHEAPSRSASAGTPEHAIPTCRARSALGSRSGGREVALVVQCRSVMPRSGGELGREFRQTARATGELGDDLDGALVAAPGQAAPGGEARAT